MCTRPLFGGRGLGTRLKRCAIFSTFCQSPSFLVAMYVSFLLILIGLLLVTLIAAHSRLMSASCSLILYLLCLYFISWLLCTEELDEVIRMLWNTLLNKELTLMKKMIVRYIWVYVCYSIWALCIVTHHILLWKLSVMLVISMYEHNDQRNQWQCMSEVFKSLEDQAVHVSCIQKNIQVTVCLHIVCGEIHWTASS